ncbi:MAG: hypothetical protein ACREX3_20045, partial [Gammaproteobacteria bacterium]
MNDAKQNRMRTHLCAAALLAFLFLSGCATILESLKNLESEIETDQFGRSKALVAEGNYAGAYQENQKILSEGKAAPDIALFNMGTVSAYSLNPKKNYPRALAS